MKNLLDEISIRRWMQHPEYEQRVKVEIFDCLNSTNDYLKNFSKKKHKNSEMIHVCLAEEQTQGRGRWNRTWHSPFGMNIYCSCLVPFYGDISQLSGLSLLIGLAMIRALKTCDLDLDFKIKWPNDLFCQDKKLAGSLIEIMPQNHDVFDVIIGMGINVNMPAEMGTGIDQPWVSIAHVDRNQIVGKLIVELLDRIEQFKKTGLQTFQAEWQKYDVLAGQLVTVAMPAETITGTALGIDAAGHLRVQMLDGKVVSCNAGDASVNK